MTSEELFSKLYDMVDDELAQIEVSSRWLCTFKPLITYCKKPKLKTSTSYFSLLKSDGNSQAESCYAELNAFDIKNDKLHNGRLYMTVNNDLEGEKNSKNLLLVFSSLFVKGFTRKNTISMVFLLYKKRFRGE